MVFCRWSPTPRFMAQNRSHPVSVSRIVLQCKTCKSAYYTTANAKDFYISLSKGDWRKTDIICSSQPASMTSTTRVLNTLSTSQRARRLFANVTKSAMIKMEQNREYRKKVEQAIRVRDLNPGLGLALKRQNGNKSVVILVLCRTTKCFQ